MMGVDLTLHVVDSESPVFSLAHTRLRMERDLDLWDQIEAMSQSVLVSAIPGGVHGFFGDTYDDAPLNDPYGKPLKYVTADDLSEVLEAADSASAWNYAVKEFVASLPTATKIVLWWH